LAYIPTHLVHPNSDVSDYGQYSRKLRFEITFVRQQQATNILMVIPPIYAKMGVNPIALPT
jgi:hypothetical protein